MTVKSSISLSGRQHAFAKALVAKGRYPSVSAVLQQGVELLRREMEAEEVERQALAEILAERRAGTFQTAVRLDGQLSRMLKSKRRAHGLDR
ncbi:MAG TPA: type II toxin-antitoxin system ParD family antitoxin [Micropepsaceae bacterium]|nr:type II toxin-antitoxin system ParD family antitoxin [Micropepsaceae bacterium]